METMSARLTRLLRRSESFMKTDMVYLAKGGFWLTLGQAFSAASGLLLVIGFANLVPKEVYGTYRLVLSVAGVITAFTLTGMDVAVTQAVARGADGAFRTGFRIQLRWSLLMTAAAAIGAGWYAVHGNRQLAISLLIVGALAPVIECTSLYVAYLNGRKDFRTASLFSAIRSLVPVAALLGTMLLTDGLIPLVSAYFLSHALTSGALYLWTLKRYAPSREEDPTIASFSKHVSVTNVVSIAVSYLDKILVFHFLGAVQLAAYGIAFSLPAQMKIVTKTVSTLAFPKMSSVSLASLRSAIYQKALRLFLAFAAAVAVYIAAAPFIFRLIFPQYLEAVRHSQVLALGYLFSPSILFAQAFFAQKRQKEIYLNKLSAAGVRIALLLVLLPLYGLWGAVWAYVLGNAASFAITLFLFRRLRE